MLDKIYLFRDVNIKMLEKNNWPLLLVEPSAFLKLNTVELSGISWEDCEHISPKYINQSINQH